VSVISIYMMIGYRCMHVSCSVETACHHVQRSSKNFPTTSTHIVLHGSRSRVFVLSSYVISSSTGTRSTIYNLNINYFYYFTLTDKKTSPLFINILLTKILIKRISISVFKILRFPFMMQETFFQHHGTSVV
jgi:hypothetical protein